MRLLLPLALAALVTACSDPEIALTDATSLHCPAPGALPFRLMSRGYQASANRTIAADAPRTKDEASDTIGNPGGKIASVYLADDRAPAATAVAYHGVKARTALSNGASSMPLAGENVSLWFHDGTAWMALGRTRTDADGAYDLPDTGLVAPNGRPVYAMLEADGSCAEHFDYLFAPGAKVVVTDIDGTLTHDDGELLLQLGDPTHVPVMMGAADKLTQAWANKGYPVVYLTARPHKFRAETRGWLADLGFPGGPVITENGGEAAAYKTLWLQRMIQDFQWNVVAAYGNAATDVTAYESVGIDKNHTFIVGDLPDPRGAVAVPNFDFTQHIASYVAVQPANQ